MLKPVPSMIAALAVALVTVSTAAAITGGGVDGDAHPYVGALVVDGSVQCSGVLVAPTVFATAGHCGVDGSRVSVSFDSKLDAGWSLAGRDPRGRLRPRDPIWRSSCSTLPQASCPRPFRPPARPTRSARERS